MAQNNSGHWYKADGSPCHEVPYADPKKGNRPTTLRDAKKLRLFPSVTTVLGVLAKPGLEKWKAEQITGACWDHLCSLDQRLKDPAQLQAIAQELADLRKEAYHAIRMEEAFKQVEDAADAGTLIHNGAELALQGLEYDEEAEVYLPELDQKFPLKTFIEPVLLWAEENKVTYTAWELRLCNQQFGYAGMTDAAIQHKTGFGILDYKTRKTKPGKPVLAYDENAMQISAYHVAHYKAVPDADSHAVGCNLFISTTEPGRVEACWHSPETIRNSWFAFESACQIWRLKNNYDPRIL